MRIALLSLFLLSSSISAAEITLSAASSLQDAIREIVSIFESKNTNIKVNLNFASSGKLRAQIEKGAPVDIYLSASPKHMDIIENTGLVVAESRLNFARNSLVVIRPKGNKLAGSIDDLKNSKVSRVAIGTPTSVPAGQYAKEALVTSKIWSSLNRRLVYGANVRQVLDYVARNEVDAGIVYATDAKKRADTVEVIGQFSSKLHSSIVYPLAIIKSSKHMDEVRKLSFFITGKAGRSILSRYGFGNGE